jgi:hypothetical protein
MTTAFSAAAFSALAASPSAVTAAPPADREGADAGVGTGTGAAVEGTGKAFPGMKSLGALEATSSFVFIDKGGFTIRLRVCVNEENARARLSSPHV